MIDTAFERLLGEWRGERRNPNPHPERKTMAITLGNKVTDTITGFTGIAVSRTEFLNGCARICVQPQGLHEGKMLPTEFFDELQLEENVPAPTDKERGGPGDCAPPPRCATR